MKPSKAPPSMPSLPTPSPRGPSRLLRALLWCVPVALVGLAAALLLVERLYGVPLGGDAFRFERPYLGLLGLLLLPAAVWRMRRVEPSRARLLLSRAKDLSEGPPGRRTRFTELPAALRLTTLALLTVALMGPQSIHAKDDVSLSGIDIVLVVDLSLSMKAADIRPSRFEAAKAVVSEFIERRPNDRIGAVVFGREAYTLLPLTTDHDALRTSVEGLELESIDGRGTAIGNGVATGLNRLRASSAKSKVLILLTDGSSNSGNVSPEEAAEFAGALGVKIYTVLMGRSGDAPVQTGVDIFGNSVFDRGNHPVDPALLREMAKRTGGQSFEVSDRASLIRSFHAILDQLDRTKFDDPGKLYGELFPAFVWTAAALLLLELLVASAWLRRWP